MKRYFTWKNVYYLFRGKKIQTVVVSHFCKRQSTYMFTRVEKTLYFKKMLNSCWDYLWLVGQGVGGNWVMGFFFCVFSKNSKRICFVLRKECYFKTSKRSGCRTLTRDGVSALPSVYKLGLWSLGSPFPSSSVTSVFSPPKCGLEELRLSDAYSLQLLLSADKPCEDLCQNIPSFFLSINSMWDSQVSDR